MDNNHMADECIHYARIDVSDYFELRTWAKRFGVTAGDVRRAVSAVGDHAADVEAHLKRTHPAAAARLGAEVHWPD